MFTKYLQTCALLTQRIYRLWEYFYFMPQFIKFTVVPKGVMLCFVKRAFNCYKLHKASERNIPCWHVRKQQLDQSPICHTDDHHGCWCDHNLWIRDHPLNVQWTVINTAIRWEGSMKRDWTRYIYGNVCSCVEVQSKVGQVPKRCVKTHVRRGLTRASNYGTVFTKVNERKRLKQTWGYNKVSGPCKIKNIIKR